MGLGAIGAASGSVGIKMLSNATVKRGVDECRAIFARPGETVLDGVVMATDFEITFVTRDLPSVEHGQAIVVRPDDTGVDENFVARTPRALSDGILTTVGLQEP